MPFYSDGNPVPDDPAPKSRYDIRAEVARIEARIRSRELGGIVVTRADDAFLRSIGMKWSEEDD